MRNFLAKDLNPCFGLPLVTRFNKKVAETCGSLEGERGIFHQLLALEAEGREGQLHREVEPWCLLCSADLTPIRAG